MAAVTINRTQVPSGQFYDRDRLKTELANDPQAMGFATAGDQQAADLLNRRNVQVEVLDLPASSFISALDKTEFATLTAIDLARLNALVAPGWVKIGDSLVRDLLDSLFPAATFPNTRQAIRDLRVRVGSRAEFLFGDSFTVTAQHVAEARRGVKLADGTVVMPGYEEIVDPKDQQVRTVVPATWRILPNGDEEYLDPADGLFKVRPPIERGKLVL